MNKSSILSWTIAPLVLSKNGHWGKIPTFTIQSSHSISGRNLTLDAESRTRIKLASTTTCSDVQKGDHFEQFESFDTVVSAYNRTQIFVMGNQQTQNKKNIKFVVCLTIPLQRSVPSIFVVQTSPFHTSPCAVLSITTSPLIQASNHLSSWQNYGSSSSCS